jgi:large subunit ribosomal protein L1
MAKKAGKHVENARKKVEARPYKLSDAAELLKSTHHTKFDETVELAINLGVDPKHSDQVVRGTVVLPNGLGKSVRVLVIAGGDKVREAQDAGADFVGYGAENHGRMDGLRRGDSHSRHDALGR